MYTEKTTLNNYVRKKNVVPGVKENVVLEVSKMKINLKDKETIESLKDFSIGLLWVFLVILAIGLAFLSEQNKEIKERYKKVLEDNTYLMQELKNCEVK